MEVPPVYAQRPRNKSKVGWIIAIALGCVLCCCGGPAYFGLKAIGGTKPMLTCAVSFQDISQGIRKYALDHKGVLPAADTWQNDVREDYRHAMEAEPPNPIVTPMSADGDWSCVDGDGHATGISLNNEVAGKKLDSIADQVSTILIFETEKTGKNLHGKFTQPNYESSPKIIFGKPRGWMVGTVAGQAGLISKRGTFVPVNMSQGGSVSVQSGNGGVKIKTN